MACSDHQPNSDKKCVACFAADIVALTLSDEVSNLESKLLDQKLRPLASRYAELKKKLAKDDADYCSNVIFSLNGKLVARKHALFGADQAQFINPAAINAQHRLLYRTRLRQMGTWIGFTEFSILAELFRVRFWIAIPSGARWRRWEIGDARDPLINNPVLRWTGNHYEVATLQQYMGGAEYTAHNVIATNPRGDCGLESFLLLLIQPFVVVNPAGHDQWRARRVLQLFQRAANQPLVQGLIARGQDYNDAISELRALVAAEMTDAQVNDAIIAEGVLPGASKDDVEEGAKVDVSVPLGKQGKIDAWTKYHEDFQRDFALEKTIVQVTEGKRTCVANIGAAADWLRASQRLETYDGWPAIRGDGLRAYVPAGNGTLTHTGLMVAEVPAPNGPFLFVCAASNFHQSLVGEDAPWILKNSNQKLGKGSDMHTERFCLIQLYEWLTTQKIVPNKRIDIIWFLEKPMCLDACTPVLKLFRAYWEAKGVVVDDVVLSTSLLEDDYFEKNVGKAVKRFTLL